MGSWQPPFRVDARLLNFVSWILWKGKPPAPAIIALIPREAADLANSTIRSGVRCADTIVTSGVMPKFSSI